ncbi:MAG: hypothetical protein IK080_02900 [Clostridia bacterium]|nr:hypothetical protein [Clostridia bacterium]
MAAKFLAFLLSVLSVLLCLNPLHPYRFAMKLSDPQADPCAAELYDYICDNFCSRVLSGQQEGFSSPARNDEFDFIFAATGKYPAIRGFDFVNDDFEGVYERAVEWAARGGVVSICWHCGKDLDKGYEECKSDRVEDWDALLTAGTPEHAAFLANMDKAGAVLKRLGAQGIPVLWRPFHEFNGDWFWWAGEPAHFKALWKLMYRHFTDDLGLHNLIWVLGYSELDMPQEDFFLWYPGSRYCDIVGCDSYHVAEYGADRNKFERSMRTAFGAKPVMLHECGLIPTAEQFAQAPWCAFVAWHSEYLTQENSAEHLRGIYHSDLVITLDELPAFSYKRSD